MIRIFFLLGCLTFLPSNGVTEAQKAHLDLPTLSVIDVKSPELSSQRYRIARLGDFKKNDDIYEFQFEGQTVYINGSLFSKEGQVMLKTQKELFKKVSMKAVHVDAMRAGDGSIFYTDPLNAKASSDLYYIQQIKKYLDLNSVISKKKQRDIRSNPLFKQTAPAESLSKEMIEALDLRMNKIFDSKWKKMLGPFHPEAKPFSRKVTPRKPAPQSPTPPQKKEEGPIKITSVSKTSGRSNLRITGTVPDGTSSLTASSSTPKFPPAPKIIKKETPPIKSRTPIPIDPDSFGLTELKRYAKHAWLNELSDRQKTYLSMVFKNRKVQATMTVDSVNKVPDQQGFYTVTGYLYNARMELNNDKTLKQEIIFEIKTKNSASLQLRKGHQYTFRAMTRHLYEPEVDLQTDSYSLRAVAEVM